MSQRTLPPRTRPNGAAGPRVERDRRLPRSGRVRRTVWALVVLLALVGGAVALLASPLLDVRKVEVTGTQRLVPEQVLSAAGIDGGSALATVDAQGIRARVRALPAVATVAVHRSWPHTLRLVVTERTAQAYEPRPDGSIHLYDAEGVDFAVADSVPSGLPEIMLPTGPDRADAARAATSVLVGLPDALRTQVTTVQGRPSSSVVLVLQDGRRILWGAAGDASDTATKAAIVATLEKDRAAAASRSDESAATSPDEVEIDVSTPSIAVVR